MADESVILAQRAETERLAGGRTVCDLLAATAHDHGDLPAYSDTLPLIVMFVVIALRPQGLFALRSSRL